MKRALLSVSDKRGLVPFARRLVELGWQLVSTGGTARALTQAGLHVEPVENLTHTPEMLDGRVKTLHPHIHAGILAKNTPEHQKTLADLGIVPIDLVVVNLYPFERFANDSSATLDELIENIDIGGPSMVRGAAKNVERVTVVVDPDDYDEVLAHLENQTLDWSVRARFMQKAFAHTAHYDSVIAQTLTQRFGLDPLGPMYSVTARLASPLRYGENPHQKAALYAGAPMTGTIAHAKQHQGKPLSYNNLMDADAAWQLVSEFTTTPCCAIIKHTNPCGVALGASPSQAFERALAADPVSAFGGIVALNCPIDAKTADMLKAHFFEVIIAPQVQEQALAALGAKKNVRVLETGGPLQGVGDQIRPISGGFLVQQADRHADDKASWTVVGRELTPEQWADVDMAMKVVKHVKSNAIVVVKNGVSLGVGAGQMNRVGSVEIALKQAGMAAQGAVLASDAFFPFSDSVEAAHAAGIAVMVQPGGSIRDDEVIEKAKALGVVIVLTHRRHFKH